MTRAGAEAASQVTFYQSDICAWELPRKYDFISAWDSTWHLPLEKQEPYLKKVCDGLAVDGVYIFTTGGLDEPGENRIHAWACR